MYYDPPRMGLKLSPNWGVPGGPVVRTPHFHCPGPGVQSLVEELRSHKPSDAAKNQKILII